VNAKYRVDLLTLGFAVAIVVAGIVTLMVQLTENDVPGDVQTKGYVVCLVVAALVMSVVVRSSTTVTDEGIVVRRVGPAKRYPWREITDFRIERIGAMPRSAVQGVVLYDARMRRRVLPYVNTRRFKGIEATQSAMNDLRRRVRKAAGPERQARIAELGQRITARHDRDRTWFVASVAAFITLLATAVLLSQLPDAGRLVAGDPRRKIPLLILVLPALVFIATGVVGLVRKRRR
jgi:hypothetical protein